ncbi:MAG: hypothetical protein IKQ69_09975 [Oscillospiraceae bacterium]|nr:hypothetical protein [Oscillospiraceae bacterium]
MKQAELPKIGEDLLNRDKFGDLERGPAQEFKWLTWTFSMDPALDYVGVPGDGIGEFDFRLFVPRTEPGLTYPLVAVFGGMAMDNCMTPEKNFYAADSANYATPANQASNPCYVMNFNIPFEACASYEAEMVYMDQFARLIEHIGEQYGNIDRERIYLSGFSMGAGFAYEAASLHPDLPAALLINAGTTVHTTWGDQCDMAALSRSDANMLILHGNRDIAIPVNEAYRTFNRLRDLGKKNIELRIVEGGHEGGRLTSPEGLTEYTQWLFAQRKDHPFTDTPILREKGEYKDYLWQGYQLYSTDPAWAVAEPYASWQEPLQNRTWEKLKKQAIPFANGEGGCGRTAMGRVRIPCELVTTYDDAGTDMMQPGDMITLVPGDSLAVTPQGYTGELGDDAEAFRREWKVDWILLEGDVTAIRLSEDASIEPIMRPETVTLTYGGGVNHGGSISTPNALNGKTPYVRIDTARNAKDGIVRVALRFSRCLPDGSYASYCHQVQFRVKVLPA